VRVVAHSACELDEGRGGLLGFGLMADFRAQSASPGSYTRGCLLYPLCWSRSLLFAGTKI
jgi:hypothetical protein